MHLPSRHLNALIHAHLYKVMKPVYYNKCLLATPNVIGAKCLLREREVLKLCYLHSRKDLASLNLQSMLQQLTAYHLVNIT